MIRFLFLRVALPLLLLWLVRGILRSIFGGMNSQVATKPARPVPTTVSPGGELRKDPVCGTYVSADTSVTKRINGQTVHFCSPACRDKYRAAS
jgi:YHS domain-containing protein